MDVYFDNPLKIEAAPTGTPLENIDQKFYEVPNFNTKINLLRQLLHTDATMEKVLVFVGSMALADKVFEQIAPDFAETADYVHSKRTQHQRFEAVRNFHEGNLRILIATDLVARGIDVSNVSHVINFDLPGEPEQYMHRIGRTGRADRHGVAYTFCSPYEADKRGEIERLMNRQVENLPLPDGLEISEVLSDFEQPVFKMKNVLIKTAAVPGKAFHERSEKNRKENVRTKFSATRLKKFSRPERKKK